MTRGRSAGFPDKPSSGRSLAGSCARGSHFCKKLRLITHHTYFFEPHEAEGRLATPGVCEPWKNNSHVFSSDSQAVQVSGASGWLKKITLARHLGESRQPKQKKKSREREKKGPVWLVVGQKGAEGKVINAGRSQKFSSSHPPSWSARCLTSLHFAKSSARQYVRTRT